MCMRPTAERRRYIVTPAPIGWSRLQNDPDKFKSRFQIRLWKILQYVIYRFSGSILAIAI